MDATQWGRSVEEAKLELNLVGSVRVGLRPEYICMTRAEAMTEHILFFSFFTGFGGRVGRIEAGEVRGQIVVRL